ncbi:transposase [Gluconobacter cerinus]|nr:transposase [Gluconobacter cerinus]
MDFKAFGSDREKAFAHSEGRKRGRLPFDPALMFEILVIQTLSNLSDGLTEYLANYRLSFMRSVKLGRSDQIPGAKTI